MTWYCSPKTAGKAAVEERALRVTAVAPDSTPRLNDCFGAYRQRPGDNWSPGAATVTVRLNLGPGDGVRPHDQYQLLAPPDADAIARSITHEVLAVCTVQQHQLSDPLESDCTIDRGA